MKFPWKKSETVDDLGALERVAGLWAAGALCDDDPEGAWRVANTAIGGLDDRSAVLCVTTTVAGAFGQFGLAASELFSEFAARASTHGEQADVNTIEVAYGLMLAAHALQEGRYHTVLRKGARGRATAAEIALAVPLLMAVTAEICAARTGQSDGISFARRAAAILQLESICDNPA